MSTGAAEGRPRAHPFAWRPWCLWAALAVAVVALVPPLGTVARRTEYGEATQFALLAIAVPALVAVGAPWRRLALATPPEGAPRVFDRLADQRLRHRELPRSLVFIACDLGVAIAWHAPVAVAAVAAHGWLALVEALTLLVFGLGLWLELVESPPLVPRSGRLRRTALGALCMWTFWIMAYLVGLSNRGFYPNFHHTVGSLSAASDEQIGAVVLWFVATAGFVPVIFWNALRWLQSEEDPDAELLVLAREERRRGTPPFSPRRPGGAPSP
jgi:cytochrome c oxidase assembly factor CtaG